MKLNAMDTIKTCYGVRDFDGDWRGGAENLAEALPMAQYTANFTGAPVTLVFVAEGQLEITCDHFYPNEEEE